jgi:carbon storage regulator
MLVLARKNNESIRIGDKIILKIVAIQDGQVKIGIEAPLNVKILRSEIYDQILLSNQTAVSVPKVSVVKNAQRLSNVNEHFAASAMTTNVHRKNGNH